MTLDRPARRDDRPSRQCEACLPGMYLLTTPCRMQSVERHVNVSAASRDVSSAEGPIWLNCRRDPPRLRCRNQSAVFRSWHHRGSGARQDPAARSAAGSWWDRRRALDDRDGNPHGDAAGQVRALAPSGSLPSVSPARQQTERVISRPADTRRVSCGGLIAREDADPTNSGAAASPRRTARWRVGSHRPGPWSGTACGSCRRPRPEPTDPRAPRSSSTMPKSTVSPSPRSFGTTELGKRTSLSPPRC